MIRCDAAETLMPADGTGQRQLAKLDGIDLADGRRGEDSNSGAAETMAGIMDSLRQSMDDSGLTTYAIAKRTGVNIDSLYRFRRGGGDLSLAATETLFEFLGLKLVRADDVAAEKARPRPKAKPKGPKAATKKATKKATTKRAKK